MTSRLFTQSFIQAQIKENTKAPRHWPLWDNSPVTGEFPAQRASNAENVSIWLRHCATMCSLLARRRFFLNKPLNGFRNESSRYSCDNILCSCDSILYWKTATQPHPGGSRLSVEYETWPRSGWHHPLMTGPLCGESTSDQLLAFKNGQ